MVYLTSHQQEIPTEDYSIAKIEDVLDYFKDKEWIALDTETQGRSPITKKIITLQLGDSDNQFVIDVRGIDILNFKELIESKSIIGHNIGFDYKFLKVAGINLGKVWDTMLAECCIFRGYKDHGYGLDVVSQRYTGVLLDKTERGNFFKLKSEALSKAQIEYARLDVTYLHKIMEKQRALAINFDLLDYIEFECESMKPHMDIEINGMRVDVDAWLKNADEMKYKVFDIEKQLDSILTEEDPSYYYPHSRVMTYKKVKGKKVPLYNLIPSQPDLFSSYQVDRFTSINWASDDQVIEIFRKVYKLDPRDLDGTPSTGFKVLLKLSRTNKLADVLMKHREASKEVSTYGEAFIKNYLHEDNRIRTSFWQIRDTGRSSSGSKRNLSPNTQNIPPDTHRKFFITDPGNKFITCDFSQQEPRVLADKCQDPILLDFVLNGDGDSHSLIATIISPFFFDKEIKVTKENNPIVPKYNDKIRQIGKIINLGLDYGKTAYSIKDDLQCTEKEAEDLVKLIKDKFKGKETYFAQVIKESFAKKYILIENVLRSKTFLPQMKVLKDAGDNKRLYATTKGEIERLCQNYPIQGTAALMTKQALIFLRQEIINRKLDAKIVNVVHDEIDLECKEEIATEVSKIAEDCMIRAGKIFCESIPMKVDICIDDHWSK